MDIWTICIGIVAGIIARLISSEPNQPSRFILSVLLGIVGAGGAAYLGQALGWYRPNQGAGLIGAVVGAVILLFIWNFVGSRRSV
jgi:uncharacterized membrane protein YeaQ/YmgE (transglycosylase-associated protein family)